MPKNSKRTIERLLASEKPAEIRRGLKLIKDEISRVGADEAFFEMVSAVFYIDPLDRPDLMQALDEAISLVADFGKSIIPVLMKQLEAGDLKAQMAVAQALGRMGDKAIDPLMAAYQSSDDASRRAFILYALGKIQSPKIARAAPLALQAAGSPDLELRDTATRAIGKFAQSIPPSRLAEKARQGMVHGLRNNLTDPNPGIRAKAVRSLGKLAKHGHLNADERRQLKATCLLLLGRDEKFEWDRAFTVRKEAEEALNYVRDRESP